jgi:hypothetical protein
VQQDTAAPPVDITYFTRLRSVHNSATSTPGRSALHAVSVVAAIVPFPGVGDLFKLIEEVCNRIAPQQLSHVTGYRLLHLRKGSSSVGMLNSFCWHVKTHWEYFSEQCIAFAARVRDYGNTVKAASQKLHSPGCRTALENVMRYTSYNIDICTIINPGFIF